MAAAVMIMWKRAQDQGDLGDTDTDSQDYGYGPDDDGYNSWWWSPTGMAIRYTILIILFAGLLLFLLGGYFHAQRRMRKGLPPLRYHAWMVRRAYRRSHPYYQHQQAQYPVPINSSPNAYQNPPPAYNPYSAPPPAYQPPEGASKVLADQQAYAHAQRAETQGESSTALPLPPLPVVRQ